MAVADLGVVDQAFGAGGIQSGGDVDDMDVGIVFDLLAQGDIGQAEAIAVPVDAAFGHAQRTERRFGQVVDQDRCRAEEAERLDQVVGFGNIRGVGGDVRIGRGPDQLVP